eukprot:3290087-Prymnesium_polylepis.3
MLCFIPTGCYLKTNSAESVACFEFRVQSDGQSGATKHPPSPGRQRPNGRRGVISSANVDPSEFSFDIAKHCEYLFGRLSGSPRSPTRARRAPRVALTLTLVLVLLRLVILLVRRASSSSIAFMLNFLIAKAGAACGRSQRSSLAKHGQIPPSPPEHIPNCPHTPHTTPGMCMCGRHQQSCACCMHAGSVPVEAVEVSKASVIHVHVNPRCIASIFLDERQIVGVHEAIRCCLQ